MIIYENTGTFDLRGLTIMGINSKPNTTSPIGFFGTGFKYAVAVLARTGHDVFIQDGNGNEFQVQQSNITFRDKNFTGLVLAEVGGTRVIELPYTTELGKNWELWMVLRELESNMRDEPDGRWWVHDDERTAPTIGKVRIIVIGQKFQRVVTEQRTSVFFDALTAGKRVIKTQNMELVLEPSVNVYYRGILVYTLESACSFTLNLLAPCTLTEDRTLRETWNMWYWLKDLLFKNSDTELLKHAARNSEGREWRAMSMPDAKNITPEAATFLLRFADHGGRLNQQLAHLVMGLRLERGKKVKRELSMNDAAMLKKAIANLKRAGYDVDNYEIMCVDQLPNDVLGLADLDENKIILSKRPFENGLEDVMGTLLEEFAHLAYMHRDETREMQDWLLRQVIQMIMHKGKVKTT